MLPPKPQAQGILQIACQAWALIAWLSHFERVDWVLAINDQNGSTTPTFSIPRQYRWACPRSWGVREESQFDNGVRPYSVGNWFSPKADVACFLQKKATKTPSMAFPTGHIPSLSERLAPERVVMMLNRYLTTMVAIIKQYQGTIDEFIGDAMAGNGSHLTTPGCLNFRGRLVSFCTASR